MYTYAERKAYKINLIEKRKKGILESLENLFQQAEKLKMWFCCPDNKLIVSPRQLKLLHSKGLHRHNNWILIDPEEEINKIQSQIDKLTKEKDRFFNEITHANQDIDHIK